VNAGAAVHHGGRFQQVRVVNYSAGGLQLEGTFGLIKGDAIEIEFAFGARVNGRVAWSLGARTGISFFEALPTDHPVFIALTRLADKHLLSRMPSPKY
jgi:hypothetical protein